MRDLVHSEACVRAGKCTGQCDWGRFHADLEAPLMPWEIAAEKKARERLKELMRGNIPA